MDIRDTLSRIKSEADTLAAACSDDAGHACPACEIQFLADEALAALAQPAATREGPVVRTGYDPAMLEQYADQELPPPRVPPASAPL